MLECFLSGDHYFYQLERKKKRAFYNLWQEGPKDLTQLLYNAKYKLYKQEIDVLSPFFMSAFQVLQSWVTWQSSTNLFVSHKPVRYTPQEKLPSLRELNTPSEDRSLC